MSGRAILLLLLDGLADRTWDELGGLTPLEAAATPNLDRLAAAGASALVYPVGPGLAPPSEVPHFHLFGYADYPFPGRAVLEALGHGVDVPFGRVVAHAGLRHITPGPGGFAITDWWPEGEAADARPLLAAIARFEAEGVRLTLTPLSHGDALLAVDGGDEGVTDSDPFFFTGLPVARVEPLSTAADPAAAARTARALNRYLLWAHGILDRHPVNEARRRRGARPMNMLVTKWTGRRRPLPLLERRLGLRGAIVGAGRVYEGFAALLGMGFTRVPEREDDPAKEMAEKLEAARALFAGGAGFVHVHTKAADEAAHAHDPARKRDVIAALDRGLDLLWSAPDLADVVVAATADHTTPSRGPLLHSGDAVPLAIAAPTIRRDDVTAFAERAAARGALGTIRARDVMPLLLNAADRTRFLGGRLAPDDGLGLPAPVALRPGDA